MQNNNTVPDKNFCSKSWDKKSSGEILNDIASFFRTVKEGTEQKIEGEIILICANHNITKKEIVEKVRKEMNKKSIVDISYEEVDDLLFNSEKLNLPKKEIEL